MEQTGEAFDPEPLGSESFDPELKTEGLMAELFRPKEYLTLKQK